VPLLVKGRNYVYRKWSIGGSVTAAKHVIKWNTFRLNKSLRKLSWLFEKRKKIKITLPFSTCMLVAVWRADRSYYAVTTFLDGNAAHHAACLVVISLEGGQQSLIIIVIIFICIILITSAFVKHKINRAGIERTFQIPCKSFHKYRPRLAHSNAYNLSPWQWA